MAHSVSDNQSLGYVSCSYGDAPTLISVYFAYAGFRYYSYIPFRILTVPAMMYNVLARMIHCFYSCGLLSFTICHDRKLQGKIVFSKLGND